MWWIISFVALVILISVVINRRGSTGASRADDRPGSDAAQRPDTFYYGPSGGADGGGAG